MKEDKQKNQKIKSGGRRILLSIAVFLAGAAFMYAGLCRGEAEIVLRKAVHLCLECIGIG